MAINLAGVILCKINVCLESKIIDNEPVFM